MREGARKGGVPVEGVTARVTGLSAAGPTEELWNTPQNCLLTVRGFIPLISRAKCTWQTSYSGRQRAKDP